MFVIHPENLLR